MIKKIDDYLINAEDTIKSLKEYPLSPNLIADTVVKNKNIDLEGIND